MKMEAGSTCVRGFALSLVVALAACGGGGSDSEQPAAPSSPTPVVPAALDLDQAVLLAGRVGNLWGLAQTVSVVSERLVKNYTLGGSDDSTGDCELAGSITDSYRDTDSNGKLSAGDSLGMVGHACREYDEARLPVTTTGSVSALLTQVEGIAFYLSHDRWLLNARQTYQELAMSYPAYSFRWNGSAEVSDNAARSAVRFDNLFQQLVTTQTAVIRAMSGEVHREYGNYLNKTVKSLLLKELTLHTNLVGTNEVLATIPGESRITLDPTGAVVASGEIKVLVGKDAVIIAVTGVDQVRVDLDLQGDGTVDASRALTWSAMVNNAVL